MKHTWCLRLWLFALILLNNVFNSSICYGNTRNDSIKAALEYQRSHYPVSHYRDVYKNFMQDFYGPGHILTDTVAAARYLRYELTETKEFGGPDYEPTGFQGNFYRVNIRLIADGTIPYDVYFRSFVESVQDIVPPHPKIWMSLWSEIDKVISQMEWRFDDEEEDRSALSEQFSRNEFIAHHSKAYNEAVNFHYRIISKDIFETKIRPYLTY